METCLKMLILALIGTYIEDNLTSVIGVVDK